MLEKEMAARPETTATISGKRRPDDNATVLTIAYGDTTTQTLQTAFALKGHALHSTDPTDGPVEYWAERWGLVRYLPTIDAARRFLEAIGGRL